MRNNRHTCVLALDLGTTAFKCAAVGSGGIIDKPVTVKYHLEYAGGRVTCPAARYLKAARSALTAAAAIARRTDHDITAIGIGSQAQTFLALDRKNRPLAPAIVWTDARADREAMTVAATLPDFARHSGFHAPLPLLFLPKVMHSLDRGGLSRRQTARFLLLNEFIILNLTGHAYGDEVNQGMGGFYDIGRRVFSPAALKLAGLQPGNLATVAPAAGMNHPLSSAFTRLLKLPAPVPVFSCGNDQGCGAAGAGLRGPADLLCNFGTAMVAYTIRNRLPARLSAGQIAGIDPLTRRYFVLGVESECGNILDWARATLFPDQSMDTMLKTAILRKDDPDGLPSITLHGNGRFDLAGLAPAHDGVTIVNALLYYYARTLARMVGALSTVPVRHAIAAGGLSTSAPWRSFFSRQTGLAFKPAPSPHLGLLGIRAIIHQWNKNID